MQQVPIPLEAAPSYAPQDFVLHESLQPVWAQLAAWRTWPTPVMALVGPKASGKTHLLHALAVQHPIQWHDAAALDAQTADAALAPDVLHVMEDIDAGVDEAALAQRINAARAMKRALLLTSASLPARLPVALPDLASRLKALDVVQLPAPDEALLAAVMMKRFSDLQWRVAPEVVQYVVTRLPREFVALAHFIQLANHHGLATGRALTLPFAREMLALSNVQTGNA